MAPMNKMSKLLAKVERRLGTKRLNLPDELSKRVWAEVVIPDETLTTFSRFFPNEMMVILDHSMRMPNGWYCLDSIVDDSIEILGVKDIDWPSLSHDALAQHEAQGYGIYSVLPTDYSYDDIAAIQMRADLTSIFINQIFPKFKAPNRIKLESCYGTDITKGLKSFPVTLFIKHASNLMTIAPTKMEILESLATCDVAKFLYEELKYYEGIENVLAGAPDFKLGDLADEANKRDDIVSKLEDAYVGPANENQPIVLCV